MALLRLALRHQIGLARIFLLPQQVAIATGHIGENRLLVEKTDDDLGPIRSPPRPAALAFHAMGECEIRRFGLPGEGMDFVHARPLRGEFCGESFFLLFFLFRLPSAECP